MIVSNTFFLYLEALNITYFLFKSKVNKLFTKALSYKTSVTKDDIKFKRVKRISIRPPTSPRTSINCMYCLFSVNTFADNWRVTSAMGILGAEKISPYNKGLAIRKDSSYLKNCFLSMESVKKLSPVISSSVSMLTICK